LELHPEKTRLIEFGRYAARDRQRRGAGKPKTFTFLVVNGYCQYHAVPGNIRQLSTFRQRINRLWYQVLARRSQRARKRWEALTPLFERWIPRPKVLHPYPQARFYATHPS